MSEKLLSELLVVELKSELEKRNLDKTGIKTVLHDRLREALIKEGLNPDEHMFKVPPDSRRSVGKESDNTAASNQNDTIETKHKTDCDAKETESGVDHIMHGEKTTPRGNSVGGSYEEKTEMKSKDACDQEANDVKAGNACENVSDYSLIVNVYDEGTSDLDKELLASDSSHTLTDRNEKSEEKSKSENKDDKSIKDNSKESEKVPEITGKENNGVWVNNISSETKAFELKNIFSKYGKVSVARIVKKSYSGGHRFCGFVLLSDVREANNCIKALNQSQIEGHTIVCVRGDGVTAEDLIKRSAAQKKEPTKTEVSPRASVVKTKLASKPVIAKRKLTGNKGGAKGNNPRTRSKEAYLERKYKHLLTMQSRLRKRESRLKDEERKLREIERKNREESKRLAEERVRIRRESLKLQAAVSHEKRGSSMSRSPKSAHKHRMEDSHSRKRHFPMLSSSQLEAEMKEYRNIRDLRDFGDKRYDPRQLNEFDGPRVKSRRSHRSVKTPPPELCSLYPEHRYADRALLDFDHRERNRSPRKIKESVDYMHSEHYDTPRTLIPDRPSDSVWGRGVAGEPLHSRVGYGKASDMMPMSGSMLMRKSPSRQEARFDAYSMINEIFSRRY